MEFDRKENRRNSFNKKKFKKHRGHNAFSDYDEHRLKKAFKQQKRMLSEQENDLEDWDDQNEIY